ncbi:family 16 glycoside hydrolase [Luteolibacter marinus]|uniref:family 16 glycoside hydrolase n=1 Tax=Luteolibacter marinus TaxID=2776705 RepID=UPI001865F57F|nr:family 16 glycoside hydrolase [Luteolibacter marinus]
MSLRLAIFLGSCVPLAASADPSWRPLFNGKDLAGWTVTVDGRAPGEDPDRFVQVRDGAIHMYAGTDPAEEVPFGVITHEGDFSRFHLVLEYRWMDKKFAPRKNALRDAGLLYHASATDKVWPDSVEYQIQEGDSGDIVFINEDGLTWAHPDPDRAPEGQGDPGLLPENGGVLRGGGVNYAYIGRFPEHDQPGWNRVEVIVHAGESAEHWLNGHLRARLGWFHHLAREGELTRGKICLQLEAAEIQYRNIEVRELDVPLQPDKRLLPLSAVKGHPSRAGTVTVRNPLDRPLSTRLSLTGKDAAAFTAVCETMTLGAGESAEVEVRFKPGRGAGRYSAGLQVGTPEEGTFVWLQGIGLEAFEGKNEPPLQDLVHALGIPLDVGGKALELDTAAPVIGDGVAVPWFVRAEEGEVRVTPLARFSPPGATPFGYVTRGSRELAEVGKLADSSVVGDAHQCLLPPLQDGKATAGFEAPEEGFAFYLDAHQYTSFTDPGLPTEAKIAHTARVYPVTCLGGRTLENAYLIGFEEAANGDYQDAVFLLENVKPAR